jgi:hypothetical protein
MTKIERLERALEFAKTGLHALSRLGGTTSDGNVMARKQLEGIDAILNPPPVYEDVEESAGWANIYPKETRQNCIVGYATKEEADKYADHETRIDCQEIKVKVRREKVAPVERSVQISIDAFDLNQPPEIRGKSGTFIFTDPPK